MVLPAEPAGARRKKALRILVAEDDAANRKLMIGLLERDGHAVTAVHSGRDAVDRVLSGTYDVLLMDLQMPEMDGIAAAKAIRQAEEARGEGGGLYVAAMSANSTPESRKQCGFGATKKHEKRREGAGARPALGLFCGC